MSRSARVWPVLVLALLGCRATDDLKQGGHGEHCNGRDLDCRDGLICDNARCTESGPAPTYDCGDICARLSACEATVPGCEADCRISTTAWALRAREEFGVCLVEELTCTEAQATFAPQLCYSRITIPQARAETCFSFAEAAQDCGASTADAERILEECAAVARVRTEDVWMGPARCASVIETGICSEVGTCFSQELDLDPVIEFVVF